MATTFFGWTEMTEGQASKYVTFNEALSTIDYQISRGAECRLASKTADMTTGLTTVFTPPTGRKFIASKVVVHSATTALTAGTNYTLGDTIANWSSGIDLSGLTSILARTITVSSDNVRIFTTTSPFSLGVVAGATNASTATIDLFGYLI